MNTVDFYLRLSLEDGDQQDESNSITSQREILKDYIHSKEEFTGVQIREHIDDGYTGTNFVEVGQRNFFKGCVVPLIFCVKLHSS